jgi:hypothetical protein|nr:MAG TPA: hypothetical protein [Caudoviricetes sp.]
MTRQGIKLTSYRYAMTFNIEFDYDVPGDRREKLGAALRSIIGLHDLNYKSSQAIKKTGSGESAREVWSYEVVETEDI